MSEGTRVEGRYEVVGGALTALNAILAELQTHTTQNTTIIQQLQLLTAVGVKTLYGLVNAASTDDITNSHSGSFTLTKVVLREVATLDNDFTISIGTPASPTLYANAIPILLADFAATGEVTIDSFASYVPVAPASDFRITLGGAAAAGSVEPTLIGVI
jgi:hypothetical protein